MPKGARSFLMVALVCSVAQAGDKLVVVDKLAAAGKAKVVFVEKSAGVTKGSGTDVEQIASRFYVSYGTSSVAGAFFVPAGSAAGWVVNRDTIAKFRNTDAPGGSTEAKAVVIKPGKLVKLVAKGIGDFPFDIVQGGPPPGDVNSAFCIGNEEFEFCRCSLHEDCTYKTIAGGTGGKLVCKNFALDGHCDARCQAGDGICSAWCGALDGDCAGCFADQGLTVTDSCRGLEWEKKTASDDTPNPADLHDVDNRYSWAGRCSISSAPCQPTAAAETECLASASSTSACLECPGGEGVCDVDPFGGGAITTAWDWVSQLNVSAFGGSSDWRLPSLGRQSLGVPSMVEEMESIYDPTAATCSFFGPCVDPLFLPTEDLLPYWSRFGGSTNAADLEYDLVPFGSEVGSHLVGRAQPVRAVRSLP